MSKHQNHLLKSPWCVHPKTGRVCVPFDPAHVEDFDPFAVPTISDLVKQIDAHDKAAAADGSAAAADGAAPTVRDCDKTKMAAPLAYFEVPTGPAIDPPRATPRESIDRPRGASDSARPPRPSSSPWRPRFTSARALLSPAHFRRDTTGRVTQRTDVLTCRLTASPPPPSLASLAPGRSARLCRDAARRRTFSAAYRTRRPRRSRRGLEGTRR